MLRILGISGSLRQGSHNTSLLRAAAKLLPPGVGLEVFGGSQAETRELVHVLAARGGAEERQAA
jgi:NAD(P)H-dependent FMN reductase